MAISSTALICFFVILFTLAISGAHATGDKPWTMQLKAGTAYDDNVIVEQSDTNTGTGDYSVNFDLTASYKFDNTASDNLSLGYGFSQNLHKELSALDLQMHDVSLSASSRVGGATVEGNYYFYHISLGGRNFLDMHFINPNILYSLSSQVFLRADYTYIVKSFLQSYTQRSASHHRPELEVFYFFDRAKAYLLLGANYQRENANGSEFTFSGYELKTRARIPLDFIERGATLTVGYGYLHHDYENVTPSIGVRRWEHRHTIKAGAEFPINDGLSVAVADQFINRRSDLPVANYKENVAKLELCYRF